MKIIKFLGGLGNQMFQYAFYKAMSHRFENVKADVTGFNSYKLHAYEIEDVFNIKLDRANPLVIDLYSSRVSRKIQSFFPSTRPYFEEVALFSFDENMFNAPGHKFYWGYWQNENYFKGLETELRRDFGFKKKLDAKNQLVLDQLESDTNSVSIHIRRGDYINHPLLGGICDLDYYKKAITYIISKIKTPNFYVFSNDIAWCNANLTLPNATFISGNNGNANYIDMQLMSNCKHNIIANSSFSWWGAWLNDNKDKIVIGPKKWTNEIAHKHINVLSASWIKL